MCSSDLSDGHIRVVLDEKAMPKGEVRGYRREHVIRQIRTTKLVTILQDAAEGKVTLKPEQIASARILLDRVLPTLSSTEYVESNPMDKMSEDQILAKINALLSASPFLWEKLQALRAGQAQVIEAPTVVIEDARAETDEDELTEASAHGTEAGELDDRDSMAGLD